MSTMEMLIQEVSEAPNAMLDEVLGFVRFLKSSRFAPDRRGGPASASDGILAAQARTEGRLALLNDEARLALQRQIAIFFGLWPLTSGNVGGQYAR